MEYAAFQQGKPLEGGPRDTANSHCRLQTCGIEGSAQEDSHEGSYLCKENDRLIPTLMFIHCINIINTKITPCNHNTLNCIKRPKMTQNDNDKVKLKK